MASVQDVEVQDQVPLCQGQEGATVSAKRSRSGVIAGTAVAFALCCAAAVCFLPTYGRAEDKISVRALLESDELADLTTNNIMSMGKKYFEPTDRENVRAHVAGRLQHIKSRLQAEHPEDFKHLSALKLTAEQKDFAKKVVGSYGDFRVLAFTDTVRDAVRETVHAKGDHESLKRRLSEKLAPHAKGLKDMVEELFPGHSWELDVNHLPVVQSYASLEAVFDAEPSTESAARRLSDEEVLDAVSSHVHTLFEALEHVLGGAMPSAPTRMLSSSSSFLSDPPSGSEPTEEQKQSFIACCMKAFPNPITVCGCVAKNISSFMSMIMGFISGNKNK